MKKVFILGCNESWSSCWQVLYLDVFNGSRPLNRNVNRESPVCMKE